MNLPFSWLKGLALPIATILLAAGFVFGAKHFENYFPLQEGLVLEYEVRRTKDGTLVEQLKEKVTNLAEQNLGGKRVVPRKYEMAGKVFFGYFNKDNEGIMFLATKTDKDATPNMLSSPFYYIKNPLKVGAVWGGPDGPKGTVESVSDTVTTPAGTFKDCVKIKITYPQSMAMNEGIFWYAEKIGIVQSAYIYKNALKEEFKLISTK